MDSPGVSRETPDSPNDFPGTQAPDHATPTKAEFCHTTNLTDVHTGRAFTQSIHNSTRVHILGVLGQFIDQVPFCDRLNHLSQIRPGVTNAATKPQPHPRTTPGRWASQPHAAHGTGRPQNQPEIRCLEEQTRPRLPNSKSQVVKPFDGFIDKAVYLTGGLVMSDSYRFATRIARVPSISGTART